MESTLIRDDRIIVSQLTPAVFELNRGDVVVFVDPGGWLSQQSGVSEDDPLSRVLNGISVFVGLSSQNDNQHLVKRVVGLPGDTVVCCDELGAMSVNGVALAETYVQLPEGVSKVSSNDFEVIVPEGSLWVMGGQSLTTQQIPDVTWINPVAGLSLSRMWSVAPSSFRGPKSVGHGSPITLPCLPK